MKTYIKLFTAILLIGVAPNAYAQGDTTGNQNSNQQSSALPEAVQAALEGIVDSVANDDKSETLELLADACEKFPAYAANFVTALLNAILQANQSMLTSRGVSAVGGAANVNTTLVGEIVATAINAAPSTQANNILNAALLAAPYASTQINLASTDPLNFSTSQGATGDNLLNPATVSSNTPNQTTTTTTGP